MKFLAVLALSLALLAPAAPSLAQPRDSHADRRGPAPELGGAGGERHGGYGQPRGPVPHGAGLERRDSYPGQGGVYMGPRGSLPDRRGPGSLGGDWGGQQDEVRAGVRQGRYISLGQVIGAIRQHMPGRQLDAGLEQWGGRAVYRVRWAAPNGRRIDYIVDAHSGAILRADGG